MYLGLWCSRICDDERVFQSLVSGLRSNGFCIINLALFFIVKTNKNLCKSKAIDENNVGTHTSLSPTFLGWQKATFRITKWVENLISSFGCNQYEGYTTPNVILEIRNCHCNYRYFNLRLMTKARACNDVSQKGTAGVTSHVPKSVRECEGMNFHTLKWAPTLGVEVPMDSWIFRKRLQGLKPIGSKSFLYHWKAFGT